MKVLVLVHESLVPPDNNVKKSELRQQPWKTEYDVIRTLKLLKHNVKVLGVRDDLKCFRDAIDEFKPKIVFNLLEEFAGEAVYDQNVVSYLELLNIKYTGASPRGLMLCRDKALAKKILKYHKIRTAQFWEFKRSKKIVVPKEAKYPLIVKTLNEEASLGITQHSVVKNDGQLVNRIEFLFDTYETDVIVEEYIDGREFYVGVLGNGNLRVLPILELDMNRMPSHNHKIATNKIKWDLDYRRRFGIKNIIPKNIDGETYKKILKICKSVYKALDLNGYARIDLRMDERGHVYFLEANPNPDIGSDEEFAHAASEDGVDYPSLISNILKLGLLR